MPKRVALGGQDWFGFHSLIVLKNLPFLLAGVFTVADILLVA